MEAKGPSVCWELRDGKVPLQESLPSRATKKSAVGVPGACFNAIRAEPETRPVTPWICAKARIARRLMKTVKAHLTKLAMSFRLAAIETKGDIACPWTKELDCTDQVLNGI